MGGVPNSIHSSWVEVMQLGSGGEGMAWWKSLMSMVPGACASSPLHLP